MDTELRSNAEIDQLLSEGIERGDFPSAVYAVEENGLTVFANALGWAVRKPEEHRAALSTIYDLASLTKPLVTGFLCALLVERGLIEIGSPVSKYLPEFNRADKADISIKQLLTHSSGFPAWRPLYLLPNNDAASVLELIASETLASTPGTHVLYSDLGFITLGLMIERVTSKPVAQLAVEEIFRPLRLERTFFNPKLALRYEVAASETGNAYERRMCEETSTVVTGNKWRTDVVWCEVHDGNAFFLGGAAGHAGLFSTASETCRIAEQFVASRSMLLSAETCALFRQNLTPGLEEARSFGWQLAATKDSTAGPDLPPDSFGHNGFTGTCCWVDSAQERVYVLLTNRTHVHELPFTNINSIRRRFNSLATFALNSRK